MSDETLMDMELVKAFDATGRAELTKRFTEKRPASYDDIFAQLCEVLAKDCDRLSNTPDLERITVIDHGEYQGTRVFVVGETGYQPHVYWIACVSYGSCSSCDTFEAIGVESYSGDKTTEREVGEYVTLALHILQSMRRVR